MDSLRSSGRSRWMILLLALLVLPLLSSVALAKSWSIPRAEMSLTLQPDGSLAVTERRTYRFSGSFSHAFQRIRYPDRSTLSDLQLTGPTGPYQQAGTGAPETFTWSGDQVDWYFQLADTEATFLLSYRLSDAIRMHEDGAELYWQVIGTEWEAETEEAEIRIELPGEPLDAWLDDSPGKLSVLGRTVTISAHDLQPEDGVTIRILLPREAVAASTLPSDGATLDEVQKRAWRQSDPFSVTAHVAAAAALLLLAFWFYRLHVRRPRFTDPGPAGELPAALVAKLTDQDAETGLRAALLDLSLSGVITVTQEGDDWRFTRVHRTPVPHHAHGALAVLLRSDQNSVTLGEWRESRGRENKTHEALITWWLDLKHYMPEEWFLPYRWWGYLAALAVIPLLVLTYTGPTMFLPIVAALLLLALSLAQRRYSDEGERVKAAFMSHRKRLLRGEIPIPELALAVGLGLSLTRVLDPTLAIGEQFRWFRDTSDTFHDSYLFWTSSSSSGGGDGGGDGGGGGGDGGGGGGAE